jgi:hypothetical protein
MYYEDNAMVSESNYSYCWVRMAKTNKTKAQHNMGWAPPCRRHKKKRNKRNNTAQYVFDKIYHSFQR